MLPQVSKFALLVLGVALAGSVFIGQKTGPRKLALLGSSLVALATVARRHFAAEDLDL